MAIPFTFNNQHYSYNSTMNIEKYNRVVEQNNFKAALLILNMIPLLFLGLFIIEHYCSAPIIMNGNTLLFPQTNPNGQNQGGLPVAPPQESQPPLLPEITATLGTVDQPPLVSN